MIQVKIIKQDYSNHTALVEWLDGEGYHRGTIPEEVIQNSSVVEGVLDMAIPYGINWEYVLDGVIGNVTPQSMAQALYKAGIWTVDDIRTRSEAAQGAIKSAYGADIQVIFRAAFEYAKEQGEL